MTHHCDQPMLNMAKNLKVGRVAQLFVLSNCVCMTSSSSIKGIKDDQDKAEYKIDCKKQAMYCQTSCQSFTKLLNFDKGC